MVVPFTVVGPSDETNAMPQILMASRNLRGLPVELRATSGCVSVCLRTHRPPFFCTDIQLRNSLVL